MLYRKPIEHNYTLETRLSRSDTGAMAYLSDLLVLYGKEKRYAVQRANKGISDSKLNTLKFQSYCNDSFAVVVIQKPVIKGIPKICL